MRSVGPYRCLPATDVPHHLPLQTGNRAVALFVGGGVSGQRLSVVGTGLRRQFWPLSPLRHSYVRDPCRSDMYNLAPPEREASSVPNSSSRSAVSSLPSFPVSQLHYLLQAIVQANLLFQCHHNIVRSRLPRCGRRVVLRQLLGL